MRFDDIYQNKLGLPLDSYNAYGEYGSSIHNRLKGWLSWGYGSRNGIRSTVAIMGTYTDGAPWSQSVSRSAASGVYTTPTQPDTPTSIAYFFGKRGEWSAPSTLDVDLKWSVTVPIQGKLNYFAELSVNNLFNSLNFTFNGPTLDTSLQPLAGTPVYKLTTSSTTLSQQGLHTSFTDARNYSFSCGVRF